MQLIWHRADLRIHDNPALLSACERGTPLPLVILDEAILSRADLTPRRRAWFFENVKALRAQYRALGSDLIVRAGNPASVLDELLRELRAAKLELRGAHWVDNFTPYAKRRDEAARQVLEAAGVACLAHEGQYVQPPGTVKTLDGGRYGVYTPFSRRWAQIEVPPPLEKPRALSPLPEVLRRGEVPAAVSDVPLPPAGEDSAILQLEDFAPSDGYAQLRDFPAQDGTSRLSEYFTLGLLSPRVALHAIKDEKWRSELAWRDFLAELLDRFPESVETEMNPSWRGFPWRDDAEALARWREGRTGYPIVDAAMRELIATGFMHNRARMIAASFAAKHLLLDWRRCESVFRGLLLDGDTAQNVGNWQWVAGSGCDAAPYFRVFNPVSQGKKFDASGHYVRRWLPELADVPLRFIHEPWLLPSPPRDYPAPMLDLSFGRDRFLSTAREFLKSKTES